MSTITKTMFVLLILFSSIIATSWWDSNWEERALITNIDAGTYSLLRINYTSGMLTNFNDLRFINGSTELSYEFIEINDSNYANVLVKTNDTTSLYLYFGNAYATNNSESLNYYPKVFVTGQNGGYSVKNSDTLNTSSLEVSSWDSWAVDGSSFDSAFSNGVYLSNTEYRIYTSNESLTSLTNVANTTLPMRNIASDGDGFFAISTFSVSEPNRLYYSNDTGASWNSYNVTIIGSILNDISGNSNTFVSTSGRDVAYSTDNCSSWTIVTNVFSSGKIGLSIDYGNGIWIVGGLSGETYKSINGGVGWSSITSAVNMTTDTIRQVRYNNGVWIISGDNKIVKSVDDGVTWTTLQSFGGRFLYGNGDIWFLKNQTSLQFLISNDDFDTWDNFDTDLTFVYTIASADTTNKEYDIGTTELFSETLDKIYCYQESANVSNQSGTDGNCLQNYNGTYFVNDSSDGYFYINYTKPSTPTEDAIWKIKTGGLGTSNYSFSGNTTLENCFNAYDDKLVLRIFGAYAYGSSVYCYNGSNWIEIDVISEGGGSIVLSGGFFPYLYDGDWNTASTFTIRGGYPLDGWTDTYSENGSIWEDGIYWEVNDRILDDTTNTSDKYELSYVSLNISIIKPSNVSVDSINLNYNGTNYSATITATTSTMVTAYASVFTPFVDTGTSLNMEYEWNVYFSDNKTLSTDLKNQTIIYGYYISNIDLPTSGVEGEEVIANLTIVNDAGFVIVNAYINNSNIGNLLATQLTNGTTQNWTRTFNLPAVSVQTIETIQSYIKVSYGSTTSYRYFNDTNITIYPIDIDYCGGIYTAQVLNYSLWDEQNYSKHLPVAGITNSWETIIIATANGGNVIKQFSFKNTSQDLLICIPENLTLNANVSTWVSDSNSTFATRSHFMLNKELVNGTLNQIKIFTLNSTIYANIDFFVYDVYSNAVSNRIIHFYVLYPEVNEYLEVFNLITDRSGKGVGHLKPYDTWYRIIVTNAEGVITQTIHNTQISASTYSITEESSVSYFPIYGSSGEFNYNNISKIASYTFSGIAERQYKFELSKVGFFSNETYCTSYLNETIGVVYCDISATTITEFKWVFYVYDGDQWIPIDSGEEASHIPLFGKIGLLITSFIIMTGTLIFEEPKARLLMTILTIAISNMIGLINVSDSVLIGVIFVGLTLLYLLKKD